MALANGGVITTERLLKSLSSPKVLRNALVRGEAPSSFRQDVYVAWTMSPPRPLRETPMEITGDSRLRNGTANAFAPTSPLLNYISDRPRPLTCGRRSEAVASRREVVDPPVGRRVPSPPRVLTVAGGAERSPRPTGHRLFLGNYREVRRNESGEPRCISCRGNLVDFR